MILYKTEYQSGRRVRIGRNYAGLRALVGILLDLAVALVFGIVGLAIRLVRWVLVTACRFVVGLLALPFRVARAVSDGFRRRAVAKPAWVLADEL